jgi:biopolymer transport protein ExbD
MQFHIRKKHQPPAIIIVALIDVLIVVMIFLMVTTTFKKIQPPSLKLALPESTHATRPGASENAPLIIYIDEAGALRIGPEAKPTTVDGIRTTLLAEVAKNPDLKVALSADKKAPFGQIIRVMDAAKEAKIKAINAFTKPSGQN